MNALSGAAIFVVQTLVSLYLVIVLLRFVLQLVKANFYNPLSQFAVRATQPLLKPIRRIIPSVFGLDTSSLILSIVIQALLMAFVLMVTYGTFGDLPHLLMWAIIGVTSLFLKIFWVAMIVMVIVSWIAPRQPQPRRRAGLPDQRAGAGAVSQAGAQPWRHGHFADLRLLGDPGDPVVRDAAAGRLRWNAARTVPHDLTRAQPTTASRAMLLAAGGGGL